jgi:hypothetical protein
MIVTAPAPAGIAFEQHVRSRQGVRIGFASSYKHLHMRSFIFAEVERGRSFHGTSPVFPQLITILKLD